MRVNVDYLVNIIDFAVSVRYNLFRIGFLWYLPYSRICYDFSFTQVSTIHKDCYLFFRFILRIYVLGKFWALNKLDITV